LLIVPFASHSYDVDLTSSWVTDVANDCASS